MKINLDPVSRVQLPTRPLRVTVSLVLAAFFLIALPFSADAGIKLYNMDRLLFEPHPFAAETPVDTPVKPTPPTASAPAMSAPATSSDKRQTTSVAPAPARTPLPLPTSRREKTAASTANDFLDKLDSEPDDFDPSENEEVSDNDPLEPMNRVFFTFNEGFAKYLLGPVARGYNAVLPAAVRTAIRNFLDNLKSPVILANDLLQGEVKRGTDTGLRMIINSTVGLAGFIDVAEKIGIEKHKEDFGQTLAVWGMGEGFYLVLPIFGPSNPRDAIGRFLVDGYFDPLRYLLDNKDDEELILAHTALNGITAYADVVDQLDELRESSIDFYGAMRSLYRQRRQSEILNGRLPTEGASLIH